MKDTVPSEPDNLRELPCYLLYTGWRRAQAFYTDALGDGLNPQRMYVLEELSGRGAARPARVSALAELLAVDLGTISGLLARMERDGLVERRPNPDNAHERHVVLTRAGRAAHSRAARRIRELDRELMRRVKPGDVRALRRVVRAFCTDPDDEP